MGSFYFFLLIPPYPLPTNGDKASSWLLVVLGFFFQYMCIFFDVDHFLKVFIESVTILLLLYVLVFLVRRHVGP